MSRPYQSMSNGPSTAPSRASTWRSVTPQPLRVTSGAARPGLSLWPPDNDLEVTEDADDAVSDLELLVVEALGVLWSEARAVWEARRRVEVAFVMETGSDPCHEDVPFSLHRCLMFRPFLDPVSTRLGA